MKKTLEERIEELEYNVKIDEINSRCALKKSFMGVRGYDEWIIELLNARFEKDNAMIEASKKGIK